MVSRRQAQQRLDDRGGLGAGGEEVARPTKRRGVKSFSVPGDFPSRTACDEVDQPRRMGDSQPRDLGSSIASQPVKDIADVCKGTGTETGNAVCQGLEAPRGRLHGGVDASLY